MGLFDSSEDECERAQRAERQRRVRLEQEHDKRVQRKLHAESIHFAATQRRERLDTSHVLENPLRQDVSRIPDAPSPKALALRPQGPAISPPSAPRRSIKAPRPQMVEAVMADVPLAARTKANPIWGSRKPTEMVRATPASPTPLGATVIPVKPQCGPTQSPPAHTCTPPVLKPIVLCKKSSVAREESPIPCCTICGDKLGVSSVQRLGCGHVHHTICWHEWTTTNDGCPTCSEDGNNEILEEIRSMFRRGRPPIPINSAATDDSASDCEEVGFEAMMAEERHSRRIGRLEDAEELRKLEAEEAAERRQRLAKRTRTE